MGVVTRRKCVAVDSDPLGGRQLDLDPVVVEHHLVGTGLGRLACVGKTRPVAGVGLLGGAGLELQLPHRWHNQDVAEVGVAGAVEVGVREADDGPIAVLVARTVTIRCRVVALAEAVGNQLGLGTELHEAEGSRRARKGVPHFVGADEGIDIPAAAVGRGGDRYDNHECHESGTDRTHTWPPGGAFSRRAHCDATDRELTSSLFSPISVCKMPTGSPRPISLCSKGATFLIDAL